MNIKHQGTKIVAKELNIAQSNMICQRQSEKIMNISLIADMHAWGNLHLPHYFKIIYWLNCIIFNCMFREEFSNRIFNDHNNDRDKNK